MTQITVLIRVVVAIVVIGFVVLSCILFAMAPAHSQAGGARGTPAQRRACTPDVYRLCAGEIPNAARITACLRQHKARLSEACRSVFAQ
jgi:hypothetical protein